MDGKLSRAGRPGRRSLAETATLDAGLAQQLAVLLLGHALAALLDHRAHTTALPNVADNGSEKDGPDPAVGAQRRARVAVQGSRRPARGAKRATPTLGTLPAGSRGLRAPGRGRTVRPARR